MTIELSSAKRTTIAYLKNRSVLPFVNSSVAVRILFDSRFRTLLPTNNKKGNEGKYVVLFQSLTLVLAPSTFACKVSSVQSHEKFTFVLPNRTALPHIACLYNGTKNSDEDFKVWKVKTCNYIVECPN